eukprot:296948-Rhodomonas_salina.2
MALLSAEDRREMGEAMGSLPSIVFRNGFALSCADTGSATTRSGGRRRATCTGKSAEVLPWWAVCLRPCHAPSVTNIEFAGAR